MKRISLVKQFTLSFMLIVVVLILSVDVLTVSLLQNDIVDALCSSVDLAAQSNAQLINDLVSRLETFSQLVCGKDSEIVKQLYAYTGDPIVDHQTFRSVRDSLDIQLDTVFGSLVERYSGCLVLEERVPMHALASTLGPNSAFKLETSSMLMIREGKLKDQMWYQAALDLEGESYWFSAKDGKETLCMARKLTNIQYDTLSYNLQRRDLGVMLVAMDVRWIREHLQNRPLMKGAKILIATEEGHVIYSTDEEHPDKIYSISESGDKALPIVKEEKAYVWNHPISNGLVLQTLVPVGEIQRMAGQSAWLLGATEIMIAVAGVLLITLCSRWMTQPINRLAGHMQEHYKKPACIDIPSRLPLEIGTLYEHYNGLVDRIDSLVEEVRAADRERQLEQIRTLQAQINPHFIYNTLDTVCCRALENDEDEIADILNGVSTMLRFNIRNSDSNVKLNEVMENVHLYMKLLQARRRDTLTLYVDMPSEAGECYIQKMLIQPLVENAIAHGVQNPVIRIVITVEYSVLTVRVIDRNKAADIQAINEHVEGKRSIDSKSTGMGIRNIDQRVRMLYGDAFGLHYERDKDGGCMAVLRLPATLTEQETR